MKHIITFLMTIFSFCLYLLFVPLNSMAFTWSALYGGIDHDEAASVKATEDGGSVVAGNAHSFGKENQVWIFKINSSGECEWQKVYTNTDKESYGVRSIDLIPAGGFVLAGDAQTCYETDGSLCQGYGWLAKLAPDGQIVWQKGFKDTEGYGSSFSAVQSTKDNGFIAAGRGGTLGSVTPRSKLWVVKLDPDGAIQWQRFYHHENITDSSAYSVQQTQDGGYIVAGALFSGLTGWSDGYDIWALKLNEIGNVQWHGMYRSPAGYDIGWSVKQTSDGGYAIGGQTEDSTGYGTDGLILKLDSAGAIQWQKNYETNSGDAIKNLYQTTDGGYMVGGLYQGGGVAAKLNQNGAIEWQRQYRSNPIVSMAHTSEGIFMASGGSSTRDGISSSDVLVLKTDDTGNISSCLSVAYADVQAYEATMTIDIFTVTETSPDLRIIETLAGSSDTTITPIEECPYKTINLALTTALAHVLSSPEGMECVDRNCSGLYPGGSVVDLTIYTETDASLIAWGGDCADCGSDETCSTYMNADKTCTVIFTALESDINGDGNVGLTDAILALQSIAGMNPSISIGHGVSGADVNGNERIEQAEAIYALQKTAMLRPPSTPTNVTSTAEANQATIYWNGVQDATSYNIYWATEPGVTKAGGAKITDVSSPYIHSGLINGTRYYYVVTSTNFSGESATSAETSATPFAGWIQTGLNGNIGRSLYATDMETYAGTYEGVFSTADDGMPWFSRGLAGKDVSDVIKSNDYILAATLDGVYRSADNGNTWLLTNGSPGVSAGGGIYGPHVLAKNSECVFIIAWSRGVFRSYDDGANWEQALLGKDGEGYQDYAAGAYLIHTVGEQVFINGAEPYTGADVIWFSSDNGTTWNYFYPPGHIQSLVYDNGKLFGCGSMGVYMSTDLGNTWSTQYSNIIGPLGELLGIGSFRNIISYNQVLIAAVDSNGINISRDDGVTWTSFNEGLIPDWTFTGLAVKPPYIWVLRNQFGNAYRRLLEELVP
ncbi:MAG: hypothetical protein JW882_04270 [Deltaproteobacteria bacterium]|nr:hypothetical protein [Deltaproteobacteria bacterium]